MAKKSNVGRKGIYESHVKPYFEDIKEWCTRMTEAQMAKKLGISYSTWNQYKVDHPELRKILKDGRRDLVSDLRGALIKKAMGFEYEEVKTTTESVKWPDEIYAMLLDAGFTEEQIEQSRLVKVEIAKKKAHPDVAAINLALKNYDKANWANDPQMLDIKKEELQLKKKQVENNEW